MGYIRPFLVQILESKSYKVAYTYAQKLVKLLRANPLGPALTVCLSGLLAVFVLPQLVLWLYFAPKLILTQVVLSAPFVPYCLYRIHKVPLKPLVALWVGIYVLALFRTPQALNVMPAFAISAHMSSYFIFGFLLSAVLGLVMGEKPKKPMRQPHLDSVPRAS